MIDRRTFLGASLGALIWPLGGRLRAANAERLSSLSEELTRALEKSRYVYVSPLHSDGSESTCHGEVWYGWLDGAVVVITPRDRWKSRSIARGLDRARLWVGDFGPWKRIVGSDEAFRQGPSFDARAQIVADAALLDRLLGVFDTKYPDEIGKWRDRMRRAYSDGSRVLIRYVPEGSART